jgi:hypothetical protein
VPGLLLPSHLIMLVEEIWRSGGGWRYRFVKV